MPVNHGLHIQYWQSLVSWKATFQPALSIIKAKYIALAKVTKDDIWLKDLMDVLSAICLAKDPIQHGRTKHTNIKYHFFNIHKRIEVKKIVTEENPANVFMKPILKSKYMHYLHMLNMDC